MVETRNRTNSTMRTVDQVTLENAAWGDVVIDFWWEMRVRLLAYSLNTEVIMKNYEPLAKVYLNRIANACVVGSLCDQLRAYSRDRGILHLRAGRLSRIAGSALTYHIMKMPYIRRNPLGINLFWLTLVFGVWMRCAWHRIQHSKIARASLRAVGSTSRKPK